MYYCTASRTFSLYYRYFCSPTAWAHPWCYTSSTIRYDKYFQTSWSLLSLPNPPIIAKEPVLEGQAHPESDNLGWSLGRNCQVFFQQFFCWIFYFLLRFFIFLYFPLSSSQYLFPYIVSSVLFSLVNYLSMTFSCTFLCFI